MHCAGTHMPTVSVRVAAALAGKDRSTILRAIESGKLSATKSDLGRFLIDPAELERVYGVLHTPSPVQDDETPSGDAHPHTDTVALALVREMLERERSERDRERRQWEEERDFLRTMLERRDEQVKLLADQRQPRAWLWQRVMGREAV